MSSELFELTLEIIHELIHYDPVTGKAYWKKRDVKWFKDSGKGGAAAVCARWNAKHAGKEIKNLHKGYYQPTIIRKTIALHRLIWFYQTGEWPALVDHINHIKTDNRWCNLRNVSVVENVRNQSLSSTNTSGFTGVSIEKGKWRARIKIDDKKLHLGYFDTYEEAVAARKAANLLYGFHPNHGQKKSAKMAPLPSSINNI